MQKTLRQNHVGSPWLSFSVASGSDRQIFRSLSTGLRGFMRTSSHGGTAARLWPAGDHPRGVMPRAARTMNLVHGPPRMEFVMVSTAPPAGGGVAAPPGGDAAAPTP